MHTVVFCATVVAEVSAFISLGGGIYETVVVNPYWPARPDIIQPNRGGINRKWFWIPAHTVFELSLLTGIIAGWSEHSLRTWLLVGFGSHLTMRLWSAFDFIPKALAFERAEPGTINERAARRWTRRSSGRFVLDVITCGAMLASLVTAVKLG